MAIEAKVTFMNQLEKQLSTEVTAETMNRVLKIAAEVMDGFDMRETAMVDEQDDLLDSYLDALRVQGRSQKTITRYEYMIRRLMKDLNVPTRKITVYHLRNWLAAEQKRGLKDSSLEGARQVLSAYFNWLQRESLIDRNPTANLGAIKCAKKKKKIYSAVEIEKLNSTCNCVRDRAIIAFLGSSGCRISEMIGLNREDLDLKERQCVVHGKGNKERTVYFDEVAAMLISDMLAERTDDDEALFRGQRGRLQAGGVRTMMKQLAKRAGVEHVHPHKFRRTLATNMARHGMPVQEVAHILGHEKIDTTMKYVQVLDEDVRSDYRRLA